MESSAAGPSAAPTAARPAGRKPSGGGGVGNAGGGGGPRKKAPPTATDKSKMRLSPSAGGLTTASGRTLPPLLPLTERKTHEDGLLRARREGAGVGGGGGSGGAAVGAPPGGVMSAPLPGGGGGGAAVEGWDITPDGGSASREGRQFTVANVGNNGRIYLRPTVRPAHQRYPQPHFVFPMTPPGTAGLEMMTSDAAFLGPSRGDDDAAADVSDMFNSEWTPTAEDPKVFEIRRKFTMSRRRGPGGVGGGSTNQAPGGGGAGHYNSNNGGSLSHRRAVSDSTVQEASDARESDAGAFKVVITKPGGEEQPRSKTTEDLLLGGGGGAVVVGGAGGAGGDANAPLLQVSIPSWRIGTPRFTSRGTPVIRGSSYAPTEEMRASSSLHNRSPPKGDFAAAFVASLSSKKTSPEPGASAPLLELDEADGEGFDGVAGGGGGGGEAGSGGGSVGMAAASTSGLGGPGPRVGQSLLRTTYLSTHLVIEPAMFDTLTFKPFCDDRAMVRYSSATGTVTAATPPRLVAEITSPSFLDYELISDFFLTFRSFLEPSDLLRMLVARLRWALARDDETGMVVRVRTFVALRHWILNYFLDDFFTDYGLRVTFCTLLNDFVDELTARRHDDPRAHKVQLKILAELKKCWRRACSAYWDGQEFDVSLPAAVPIAPGGIGGSRNAALDPSFWRGSAGGGYYYDGGEEAHAVVVVDQGPPRIDDDVVDARHPDDHDDSAAFYADVSRAGHIDTVLLERRPQTPENKAAAVASSSSAAVAGPAQAPGTAPENNDDNNNTTTAAKLHDTRPGVEALARRQMSPTSVASLDVVSCSFPSKAMRLNLPPGLAAAYAVGAPHPAAAASIAPSSVYNNSSAGPVATTPRALTGKRVRPSPSSANTAQPQTQQQLLQNERRQPMQPHQNQHQHQHHHHQHRRNGSLTDSLRETERVSYKNTEFVLALPYAGSLVRGNVLPPGQAFVEVVGPSPTTTTGAMVGVVGTVAGATAGASMMTMTASSTAVAAAGAVAPATAPSRQTTLLEPAHRHQLAAAVEAAEAAAAAAAADAPSAMSGQGMKRLIGSVRRALSTRGGPGQPVGGAGGGGGGGGGAIGNFVTITAGGGGPAATNRPPGSAVVPQKNATMTGATTRPGPGGPGSWQYGARPPVRIDLLGAQIAEDFKKAVREDEAAAEAERQMFVATGMRLSAGDDDDGDIDGSPSPRPAEPMDYSVARLEEDSTLFASSPPQMRHHHYHHGHHGHHDHQQQPLLLRPSSDMAITTGSKSIVIVDDTVPFDFPAMTGALPANDGNNNGGTSSVDGFMPTPGDPTPPTTPPGDDGTSAAAGAQRRYYSFYDEDPTGRSGTPRRSSYLLGANPHALRSSASADPLPPFVPDLDALATGSSSGVRPSEDGGARPSLDDFVAGARGTAASSRQFAPLGSISSSRGAAHGMQINHSHACHRSSRSGRSALSSVALHNHHYSRQYGGGRRQANSFTSGLGAPQPTIRSFDATTYSDADGSVAVLERDLMLHHEDGYVRNDDDDVDADYDEDDDEEGDGAMPSPLHVLRRRPGGDLRAVTKMGELDAAGNPHLRRRPRSVGSLTDTFSESIRSSSYVRSPGTAGDSSGFVDVMTSGFSEHERALLSGEGSSGGGGGVGRGGVSSFASPSTGGAFALNQNTLSLGAVAAAAADQTDNNNPPTTADGGKRELSLFSTHSSKPIMRPSFEAEAQKLAQIPDDADDDGGVESALLKLEGRYQKKPRKRSEGKVPKHHHHHQGHGQDRPGQIPVVEPALPSPIGTLGGGRVLSDAGASELVMLEGGDDGEEDELDEDEEHEDDSMTRSEKRDHRHQHVGVDEAGVLSQFPHSHRTSAAGADHRAHGSLPPTTTTLLSAPGGASTVNYAQSFLSDDLSVSSVPLLDRGLADDPRRSRRATREWTNLSVLHGPDDDDDNNDDDAATSRSTSVATPQLEAVEAGPSGSAAAAAALAGRDSQHPSYEFVHRTGSLEQIRAGETMPPQTEEQSFLNDDSDGDDGDDAASDLSSEITAELVGEEEEEDDDDDDNFMVAGAGQQSGGAAPVRSGTVKSQLLLPSHPLGDESSKPTTTGKQAAATAAAAGRSHPRPSSPPMTLVQALQMSPESANVPQLHEHMLWAQKPLPPTPDATPTNNALDYNNSNGKKVGVAGAAAGPESPRDPTGTKEALRGAPKMAPDNATTTADKQHNKFSVHLPFILAFESEVLAQQFTLIEKDALNEIDWKELIDMRWKNWNNTSRSWVDFLRGSPDARGVEVVVARFNMVVKWAASEVVLTQNVEERARTLVKLIHVAAHCRAHRNFATAGQVAIALTSPEVARLADTWRLVPKRDRDTLRDLEALVSPTRNFHNLRAEMEGPPPRSTTTTTTTTTTATTAGCIPFVGIYTHDLVFNAQRPSEIASSPTTAPLVNFERCRCAAAVVKTLLRLLEQSTRYDFRPVEGITERCLWMSALSDEEIRRRSEALE